ncbi:MAG: hypothetical protein LBE35_10985 [Clostridiales bacterium]|nr:hypothetical protein [Clostridiales bacterium]
MTATVRGIVDMLEMLPEEEQHFAGQIVKKLVVAWDPDFTKLTMKEAEELRLAREQFAKGEYYCHNEIDWDSLD